MTIPPEAIRHAQRTDFLAFLEGVFKVLEPGTTFDMSWVIEAIAFALATCAEMPAGRLMVTMPPRSLKSILISVAWSAWLLGQRPGERIVCVSYGDDLVRRHAIDTRKVMQSKWYCELFPDTVLTKATETEIETTAGGRRIGTSVGGSLTGLGGNWILIDDPMKAEDAFSAAERERVKRWYRSTLVSRADNKLTGRIILAMQRLHEDDLAGHLQTQGGWQGLTLPAIAIEDQHIQIGPGRHHLRLKGDALQPNREPLFVLERTRKEMGSAAFEAQWQQRPVPDEGNMIKRAWFAEHAGTLDLTNGAIYQSWDTALKTNPENDYSVCTTWLHRGPNFYLIDVFRKKLDYPDLLRAATRLYEEMRAVSVCIEDQNSGTILCGDLRRSGATVQPWRSRDSKTTRLATVSATIEAGRVSLPAEAPWLADFLHEVLGFPGVKHDDQVDSMSMFLSWMRDRTTNFEVFWPQPEDPLEGSTILDLGGGNHFDAAMGAGLIGWGRR